MFSKIVFGTGLGDSSDKVVGCMGGLRKLGAKQITLVHALNIRDVGSLYHQLRMLAVPKLEAQRKLLEGMGFKVEVEIPLGIPYYEINKIADRKGASLIVVYAETETLLGAALTGGIAYEVINRSTKPVLVMRVHVAEEKGGRRCKVLCADIFKRILYPTDFSDTAERALAYVESIVKSGCRKVTLLHVQEKARIEKYLKGKLDEFNRIDRSRLERIKKQLSARGATDVAIEIPYGHPTQEILKRVKKNDLSLIIMGSQGRGFISEVFMGSVSHNVARHAQVPVLLIPAER